MAEFLIKATDSTHPDPIKDRRGCYKRGDVVVVMPDNHLWGKEEGSPKFVKVKIPGLSVAAARKYLEPETAPNIIEPGGPDMVITRRKWRILVDNVPKSIKTALKNNGEVTVSWSQVKTYVYNKVTGLTE